MNEGRKLEAELNLSQRKFLLRLLDVQGYLKNYVFMEGFAVGFKLATGIVKELEADDLYSYDVEMEKQFEDSNR